MPIPVEIEFEAALAELEQIVEALERGGPDLREALTGYGRGVALLGHCQGILDQAERSVALLTGVDDSGQPVTAPFDAAATGSAGPALPVEAVAVAVTAAPASPPAPAAPAPRLIRKPSPSVPAPAPAPPSVGNSAPVPEAPF